MSEQLLIVDDDDVLRMVLARAFSRRGFEVVVAASVAEALVLAAQRPIDRAVIDLKLNQESGLGLIGALKEAYPAMEIVMLTGYSSIATAVEAIKLGATNYLCKPADVDEILQAFGTPTGDSVIDTVANPPSVNRLQWEHIQKVLAEHGGNISATARALNMHRRTLQRKLQKKPVLR